MKKARQICALIGVILLVALYASTLVFALIDSPNSFAMLKISIYATVIIPVLIWAMGMIARLLKKNYSSFEEDPSFEEKKENE
ncbi:hypothetical protein [Eubacterium oxidoreducens]|uniref:Uncharacterized protein n=1 Tax=Eubacterium oxidoreducens TaxID=1732 RepID=A0A1G6AGB5_EUBOX|nr:hypothetical protein [Eubacterium oxidoreducens]SDB07439.1 hypothetical protein SAMN02910417_00552 [Eubacterium oxidoreducens]